MLFHSELDSWLLYLWPLYTYERVCSRKRWRYNSASVMNSVRLLAIYAVVILRSFFFVVNSCHLLAYTCCMGFVYVLMHGLIINLTSLSRLGFGPEMKGWGFRENVMDLYLMNLDRKNDKFRQLAYLKRPEPNMRHLVEYVEAHFGTSWLLCNTAEFAQFIAIYWKEIFHIR